MEPCKGLFWWTGERLLCVQFPRGADGNTLGAAAPLADWNNHRRAWARLPKDVTQGKAFDYYPRGRWNCGRGEPICFSPLFCAGGSGAASQRRLWLDQLPVLLKADGSRHYRCYLDE